MGQAFGKLQQNGRGKNKKELRILLIGLDNAGKTSILKTLASQDVTQVSPTHGFNLKTIKTEGFSLFLWDIGGQKFIRPYWEDYYDNTDFIVYVVDSTDRKRFGETGQELFEVLHSSKLAGVPLLVLANKQDVGTATPADDIADKLSLSNITDRVWKIQPCSAWKNEGVKVGFDWLMKTVIDKRKK